MTGGRGQITKTVFEEGNAITRSQHFTSSSSYIDFFFEFGKDADAATSFYKKNVKRYRTRIDLNFIVLPETKNNNSSNDNKTMSDEAKKKNH